MCYFGNSGDEDYVSKVRYFETSGDYVSGVWYLKSLMIMLVECDI